MADNTSSQTHNQQHADLPILVLDLDETLVHAPREWFRAGRSYANAQEVEALLASETGAKYKGNAGFFVSCASGDVIVLERPHICWALANLARAYALFVYTAGVDEYADRVIKHLDPAGTLIAGYLARDDLLATKHFGIPDGPATVKDLSRVSDDLRQVCWLTTAPTTLRRSRATGCGSGPGSATPRTGSSAASATFCFRTLA